MFILLPHTNGSQLYLGGYVMKNDPEAAAKAGVTQMSGWGYLAIVCVYLYGVIYCATWQGITWLYASEIYPLYIRSLCMALTIADERLWSYVVSRSTPYMISDIGYGSKCKISSHSTLTNHPLINVSSLLFLWRPHGPHGSLGMVVHSRDKGCPNRRDGCAFWCTWCEACESLGKGR